VRMAVIGSGPAGVYGTQALTRRGGVVVDVFDGLPCPFGLVRYGVAPDHPKIRSITGSLHAVLDQPSVRFLRNVQVGFDLTLPDLHRHYDAVLVANGGGGPTPGHPRRGPGRQLRRHGRRPGPEAGRRRSGDGHQPADRQSPSEVLADWAQRTPQDRSRRLHLHFWLRPVRVLSEAQVSGVKWERMRNDDGGNAQPTGHLSSQDAQMLVRAVGYRGTALPGLPFDETTGTLPNASGRVLRDGAATPGEYVAGWTKRGPTGAVGTNRREADETVDALLTDAPKLPRAPARELGAILELFVSRGVPVVTWSGWHAIDRAETDLGKTHGRPKVGISERPVMLRAASRGTTAQPDGHQPPEDSPPRRRAWRQDES